MYVVVRVGVGVCVCVCVFACVFLCFVCVCASIITQKVMNQSPLNLYIIHNLW